MKRFTYEEAKDYALRLKEFDLWVFFNTSDDCYEVIRGFAFDHYVNIGWVPKTYITLQPIITEMFTGAVPVEK